MNLNQPARSVYETEIDVFRYLFFSLVAGDSANSTFRTIGCQPRQRAGRRARDYQRNDILRIGYSGLDRTAASAHHEPFPTQGGFHHLVCDCQTQSQSARNPE